MLKTRGQASQRPTAGALGYVRSRTAPLIYCVDVSIIAIISYILLHNVLFVPAFNTGNIGIPYPYISRVSQAYFSGWNFQPPSGPNGLTYWLILGGLLSATSHQPGTIERAVYFSSVPMSMFCMYCLLLWARVRRVVRLPASILFTMSPYFVGVFMNGDPAFSWMYALLPAYVLGILMTTERSTLTKGIGISGVAALGGAVFSLQTVLVFGLFAVPIALALVVTRQVRRAVWTAITIIATCGVALLANIGSIVPYEETSSSTLSSPQAIVASMTASLYHPLYPWILIMTVASVGLLAVYGYAASAFVRALLMSLCLVNIGMQLLLFNVASTPALWVLTHTYFLEPFFDTDKFVLLSWFTLFLTVVLLCGGERARELSDKSTLARRPAHPLRSRMGSPQLYATIVAVSILVFSGFFVSIQPVSHDVNTGSFLLGQEQFANGVPPKGYYELANFLLAQGGNFGLGFKTLLVPQNPGYIVPTYLAEDLIPGFLDPSPVLQQLVSGISSNDSNSVELAGVVGVRYYAVVLNQTPGLWYPAEAAAAPSTSFLSPSTPFPQGSPMAYLHILSSWPTLEVVYDTPYLVVFENRRFLSPVVISSNSTALSGLMSGNFEATYVYHKVSGDLAHTPFPNRNDSFWGFDLSAHDKVLSNGTLAVNATSNGADAYLGFEPNPGATYQITFSVSTWPGVMSYGSGQSPTRVVLYWDNGSSTFVAPSGGVGLSPFYIGSNRSRVTTLVKIPMIANGSAARIYFYAAAPRSSAWNYVAYGNVSIYEVDSADVFSQEFFGAPITMLRYGLYSVEVPPVLLGSGPLLVLFPTTSSAAWQLEGGSVLGQNNRAISIEGVLAFSVGNVDTGNLTLTYTDQNRYTLNMDIGNATFGVAALGLSILAVAPKWLERCVLRIGGRVRALSRKLVKNRKLLPGGPFR